MPHELPCVISVYKQKEKKKKIISPKVQKSNSVWDQKSKLGPLWFSNTQSLSDLNGLGIVLILHESEQSPAQQDEQEWDRVMVLLSSTRGCEPAVISLSREGRLRSPAASQGCSGSPGKLSALAWHHHEPELQWCV